MLAPPNTKHVVLILAHHLRRQPNMKPALAQYVLLSESEEMLVYCRADVVNYGPE